MNDAVGCKRQSVAAANDIVGARARVGSRSIFMAVPANAAKNQSHGEDQNNDRDDPACLHSIFSR